MDVKQRNGARGKNIYSLLYIHSLQKSVFIGAHSWF